MLRELLRSEDIWTVSVRKQGNRETGDPFCTYWTSKKLWKKVNELHPPRRRAEEEKPEEKVVDIEAKPEITFDDFRKASVPGR